jgi:signal transduction histidine kinase
VRPGWLDGLRARIAAVLLAALLAQFIGGEVLFSRMENAQVQESRARFLADHLTIASELIAEEADAETMNAMSRLWRTRLSVEPREAPPRMLTDPDTEELAFIRRRIAAARPGLSVESIRLSRTGGALEGALSLESGAWLHFRSEEYFRKEPMFLHYATSVLLLIACAALSALLFGHMIGRPLRRLVEAAEKVGRDEPVTIEATGPREVRQVAGAFEAMQARLLAHVRDQVQSLAAMSHDLRTPLARLRLNASMVKEAELRAALEEDVDEMEAFTTSVIDYLRGDEAEAEQRTDIASILMTIVDEARDLGESAEYDGPDRLEIVTRPLKLKRLVRNVVQNAARHAGNARVGLAEDAGEAVITVDDDGPGIAEADIESVFEPFTRIEGSRNRKTGGAGLGLAIAKRLAERLGGSIALCNRPQGGVRVTIRLPRGQIIY